MGEYMLTRALLRPRRSIKNNDGLTTLPAKLFAGMTVHTLCVGSGVCCAQPRHQRIAAERAMWVKTC